MVLRVEYGSTSFLFTGDAETLVEKEMLEKYPDLLDVDVLKVGHHGLDHLLQRRLPEGRHPPDRPDLLRRGQRLLPPQ